VARISRYDVAMRNRLFTSGTLLIAGSVGVFYLCLNGTADRLCFEWDAPWLIEQQFVIERVCLWGLVGGLWCFCAAALTWSKLRAKVAFLPVVIAVLILLAAAWFNMALQVANAVSLGEVRIHHVHDPDGVKSTVITTSSLSPKVCLWVGEGVPDPRDPDFRVLSECWAPHEIRPSGNHRPR